MSEMLLVVRLVNPISTRVGRLCPSHYHQPFPGFEKRHLWKSTTNPEFRKHFFHNFCIFSTARSFWLRTKKIKKIWFKSIFHKKPNLQSIIIIVKKLVDLKFRIGCWYQICNEQDIWLIKKVYGWQLGLSSYVNTVCQNGFE